MDGLVRVELIELLESDKGISGNVRFIFNDGTSFIESVKFIKNPVNSKEKLKSVQTSGPTTPSLVPTTTDAGAAEAAAEKTPQQAAVDKLMSKVTEDKVNVLAEQTTAHDYFIMVDGKRRMYNRVHSVIDAQYIPDSLKVKREKEAKEQLEEAYR